MSVQQYLYFPECKIIKSQLVPKSVAVISFYIKSVKNTPKHYPQHPLLDGKVEFSFGLDLTQEFKDTKKSSFFNIFDCNLESNPSKLTGKKVSAIIFFNPEADKKLDTIGLGLINESISIYNDLWEPKEIQIIAQAAKLSAELPNKGKVKQNKI